MPTPPKPYAVLSTEGKSHRTKAELEQRRKGEASLLTGIAMQEWPGTRSDPAAHKNFLRLRKLLKAICKDDALHEAVINRYSVLLSEAADMEADRRRIVLRQALIDEWLRNGEMDAAEHLAEEISLIGQKIALEKALSAKRKMLLDMEKENVMTIAAGLRSIPKKADEQGGPDKMSEMLNRRMRLV